MQRISLDDCVRIPLKMTHPPRMGTVRWASAAAFTADIAFVAGGYGRGEEAGQSFETKLRAAFLVISSQRCFLA